MKMKMKIRKMADQFQIFVKSINGKSRTLDVTAADTIGTIKAKIQEKEGVAPGEQRLIFGGKNLEDTKTLGNFCIISNIANIVLYVLNSCF